MSFQDKVNGIFGNTLYGNYNMAISQVIGKELEGKNNTKDNKNKTKENDILDIEK